MEYILDHVLMRTNSVQVKKSLLIKGGEISYSAQHLNRLKKLRVEAKGFTVHPGKITDESTLLQARDVKGFKEEMANLISNGVTTVLVAPSIDSEHQLEHALKWAKAAMVNSSLDFVVGIDIPVKKITPSLVRKCRSQNVPFILARVDSIDEFELKPWGWIREAMFTYTMPIVPIWKNELKESKRFKYIEKVWEDLFLQFQIPTIIKWPKGKTPLSKESLEKIGLFPQKGTLLNKSSFDSIMYFQKGNIVEECIEVDYDKRSPDIVTLRGAILKAGTTVFSRPGFGKEIVVKKPGHFYSLPE
jgi:hypothetical protein